MSAALTGTALARAKDLAQGHEDDHDWAIYLGPARGTLDEATLSAAWLPGVGWEERRADVLLSAGVGIDVTELGATITLTLAEGARSIWSDDRALVVIARHWFPGSGWGGWYLEAWGYLTGEGQAGYDPAVGQTLTRVATYAGYWARIRLVAHRLGRRNLAAGASIAAASPHLLTPQAEVGVEYAAQEDCAPAKAIDQLADTVAVADVFADPAVPTIGETQLPKFLRLGGPHQRGIAAGGQARFVELWAGYDLLRGDVDNPAAHQWGTFDYPAEVPAPEGNASPIIDNAFLQTFLTGGKYIVRCKAQPTNQNNSVYVQWNTSAPSLWNGVPALLAFRVKAGATENIGSRIVLQWGHSGTNHNVDIRLDQEMQRFEIPIDALASTGSVAGGLVMRFRADREELVGGDIWFELDDLHLWVGYNGANYTQQEGRALFLGCDDGAGNERLVRLANLNGGDSYNGGGEIVIPPRGSIIVADDAATFQQQFGDTGKTILQMKQEYREWFFAPGVGRMKLVWGNDPNRLDYDDPQPIGGVVNGSQLPAEEILFSVANGGVPWLPSQSLSRQSPIGTGFLAVEEFAHLGLIPPFGAAYWWVDLGAFAAPTLVADLPAAYSPGQVIRIDDSDRYTERGLGTCQAERIRWVGKDADGNLVVANRGWGGTTPALHPAGEAFIPDAFDGANQGLGLPQTGHNVDQIEIRRKPNTPLILAGAVLVSNLVAPSDPSEGGAKWERHPDWTLVQRFAGRAGNPDVITMNLIDILGGPREVRHVCLVIDEMARVNGVAQRAKVNEIIVREWQAAGSGAGGWTGHGVADLGGALAHLLTQHAGVPAAKVAVAGRTPPIGDLTLAPSMVGQALSSLAGNDGLRVRLDRANAAAIEPTPANPAYTATIPYWIWTADLVAGNLAGGWEMPRRVAQVRVAGRDAASFRSFSNAYPQLPGSLGAIVELRDLRVLTPGDVWARAVREFRAGNVRRAPLTIPTGALPWLAVGQRHLLALDELDPEGGFDSVNVVVEGYRIRIGIDDGGVTWATDVQVAELALG